MANLPEINSYGKHSSENYGVHTLRVDVGRLTLWFSYKTIVAFRGPEQARLVRENDWGPTTGKHLNWIDGGEKGSRVPAEIFEAKLASMLQRLGLTYDI